MNFWAISCGQIRFSQHILQLGAAYIISIYMAKGYFFKTRNFSKMSFSKNHVVFRRSITEILSKPAAYISGLMPQYAF
jgi:hypothetical protein